MQPYTIRIKPFFVSRGYFVTGNNGVRLFKINGRIGFARRFTVKASQGGAPYMVREKLMAIDRTFLVMHQDRQVALVCRTSTDGDYPEHFTIDLGTSGTFTASGSLFSAITIRKGDSPVARIWREQEMIRETFGLEIDDNYNQGLILSIAMAIVETNSARGMNPGI